MNKISKFVLYTLGAFAMLVVNDIVAFNATVFFQNVAGKNLAENAGLVDVVSALTTIVLCMIVLSLLREKIETRDNFGIRFIAVGIVIALGVGGVSSLWLDFAYNHLRNVPLISSEIEGFETMYEDIESGSYFWSLLSLGIIGPISEEILFRGVVFKLLERAVKKPAFAIIVSGVAFGVWHESIIQGVYTAVMGVVLGYVYYKTKDIRMSILIHVFNNVSSTLPPQLDTDAVNYGLYIANMVMILPMGFLLFRMKKAQGEKSHDLHCAKLTNLL